ncbi:MAG: hypothetical protein ACO3Z1_10965, partial [Ilumatobacteraceae bacterium]
MRDLSVSLERTGNSGHIMVLTHPELIRHVASRTVLIQPESSRPVLSRPTILMQFGDVYRRRKFSAKFTSSRV